MSNIRDIDLFGMTHQCIPSLIRRGLGVVSNMMRFSNGHEYCSEVTLWSPLAGGHNALPPLHSRIILLVITILMTFAIPSHAAKLTARQILEKAAKPYAAVNDYTVDARLTAKSPSMHVPDMNMRIYFKMPDKVHIQSKDGFALLPKQGILFGNPIRELLDDADLILAKPGRVMGIDCYAVKSSFYREDRLVDATVWVDKTDFLIRQIYFVTELSPSVRIRLTYAKVDDTYWLPSTTCAEISAPMIPISQPREALNVKRGRPMTVTIKFSNYKVNTGLDDKIFVKY